MDYMLYLVILNLNHEKSQIIQVNKIKFILGALSKLEFIGRDEYDKQIFI